MKDRCVAVVNNDEFRCKNQATRDLSTNILQRSNWPKSTPFLVHIALCDECRMNYLIARGQ